MGLPMFLGGFTLVYLVLFVRLALVARMGAWLGMVFKICCHCACVAYVYSARFGAKYDQPRGHGDQQQVANRCTGAAAVRRRRPHAQNKASFYDFVYAAVTCAGGHGQVRRAKHSKASEANREAMHIRLQLRTLALMARLP